MGSQSQEYPYLLAQVTEIREFADAKEMLSTLGVAALLPDGPATLDEAVAVYHGFGDAYKGPMVAYKLVDPWRFLSADAAPQASAVRSSAQEVEMSTDANVPAQVVETRSAATGTKRSGKQTPATEQDSAAEQDPSASPSDAKRARTDLPAVSDLVSKEQEALLTKDAMLNYVRGLGLLRWRSQLKKHLLSLHIPRGAASESETPLKWAAEFGGKETHAARRKSSQISSRLWKRLSRKVLRRGEKTQMIQFPEAAKMATMRMVTLPAQVQAKEAALRGASQAGVYPASPKMQHQSRVVRRRLLASRRHSKKRSTCITRWVTPSGLPTWGAWIQKPGLPPRPLCSTGRNCSEK